MREPVDLSSLQALRQLQAPGQPDAVGRIVSRFLEEASERLEILQRAVRTSDAAALERAAHAFKGIAGTVGANEILELAVRLERIGREGHTDGAAGLVTELEAALSRARPIFDRVKDPA